MSGPRFEGIPRAERLIAGFDEVRDLEKPTTGECIAVFASLLADLLSGATPDVRLALMRAALDLVVARTCLPGKPQETKALHALLETCGLGAHS